MNKITAAVVLAAMGLLCEFVCAVEANIAEENVEQKADEDALVGTFIGTSIFGNLKNEILEYRAISNYVTCATPVTPTTVGLFQLPLGKYLSTIAGDAGAPSVTWIDYDSVGNVTGYTAYGLLPGNINKSAYLTPGIAVMLCHNWRGGGNKVIGLDVRGELSLSHKKKSQTDYLKDTYDITGLGRTEKLSHCFTPAISLRAGFLSKNGQSMYYFAPGVILVGFNVKTENSDSIKTSLLAPTLALGMTQTQWGYACSVEVRRSFKVGKTCRTTYDNTTLGVSNAGRANCATITSLDTRASSQETCFSITIAKKISAIH